MKKKKLHILGAALGWLAETSARGAALATLVALALAAASVTALPGMAAASQDSSAPTPHKPLRVALLLDEYPDDRGPTDNLLRGLNKARSELNIVTHTVTLPPATTTPGGDVSQETLERKFKEAAANYDIIVAGSPALHELFMNHAGNYRRTRFIAVDGVVKAPNIASVTFLDTQAAFLSGAAAATFTASPGIRGMNAERILGWVGDYDTPPRRAEAEAFLQGARLVHPETRVLTVFTQSHDEEAGHRAAKELLAKGADIVTHNAGNAGLGVLRAVREAGKYAIGHTTDQDLLTPENSPSFVLFSQWHHSDAAVYDMIKAAVEDRFPGGKEEVRGLDQDDTRSGVGLTNVELMRPEMKAAFPADLPQRLRELEFEIRRGGIQVPKVQRKTLCDCL